MTRRDGLLSASFFLYFGAGGVVMPILPLLLRRKGFTDTEIGFITAAFYLAVLFISPVAPRLVEKSGHVRRVLAAGGLFTLAGILVWALGDARLVTLAGVVVFALARAPLPPLLDWLTLRALGDDSDRYGFIRLWGSGAFLLTALAFGPRIKDAPELPLMVGAALLALFVCVVLFLPEPPTVATRPGTSASRAVVGHAVMWPLLIVGLAVGLGDGVFDVGFALYVDDLQRAGSLVDGETVIARSVGVAVGAELAMLLVGPWLLRRAGPVPLILLALTAGVLRWTLIGVSTDGTVLVLIQALHGLSFAAFWLGAVAVVADYAPVHAMGSAQGLLTAAVGGLGPLAASGLVALLAERIALSTVFLGLALVVAGATIYCALRLRPAVRAVQP